MSGWRGFIAGEAHKMSKYGESARATFTSRSSVGRTGGFTPSASASDSDSTRLAPSSSITMIHRADSLHYSVAPHQPSLNTGWIVQGIFYSEYSDSLSSMIAQRSL
ncbi:BQ5605_C016g08166 [Microbotryum silenes-dioicae]|uniref:BQ5605_C016g08166 protein n=1 Tax=Microbotryum silenes-dioicae TaxID=796604 RepID=A0A2X0NT35_9BASI|nr:BQ5605_C016g08166 [Microbotryum silenes-dioicae]